ncbi:hypothetical protein DYB25_004443 [Aphanomyces astaci]|uniref:Uncharacterized protein n=1 Tax=Aphanomyces astaci TaxID=112090 RepID=A0A397CPR7_APHAT|nr:hypothetical protein DYB25_004443 [Aphanomyces astaci]RHY50600.1 hypothetical protein DYB38_004115 [Aphanomyces astaci]RHY55730.1 hypothetical protein DYB30_003354 [Aphanomyces astaci]
MGGGQSLLAAAADAAKNNCVELDWSNRRTDDNPKLVTIVPPSFVSHLLGSTLTDLRLSGNGIAQLPASFGRLVALEYDSIINRIDTFPAAALDGMRLLRVLTYTQNKYVVGIIIIPLLSLNAVDATLFHLTKLVYLDLSENGLVQLPDDDDSDSTASSSTNDANHGTWACLACLQEFHVSNNRLSRLPRGLEALPALHFLNVSNNALVELTALLVDRNDLQSLPRSITALPNLHTLSVDRKTFALLDPAVLTFCTALPTFDILGL